MDVGTSVEVLQGGYDAFTQWTQTVYADTAATAVTSTSSSEHSSPGPAPTHVRPLEIVIVGGRSGAGKTKVLHELAALGEQVCACVCMCVCVWMDGCMY
jgi:hypothetical protein